MGTWTLRVPFVVWYLGEFLIFKHLDIFATVFVIQAFLDLRRLASGFSWFWCAVFNHSDVGILVHRVAATTATATTITAVTNRSRNTIESGIVGSNSSLNSSSDSNNSKSKQVSSH
ncbi:unnamed protein product [Symbiodinium sp. CCMP2592]|nr:unnamed protein product [Symbiodinium sp. CCMP2592]